MPQLFSISGQLACWQRWSSVVHPARHCHVDTGGDTEMRKRLLQSMLCLVYIITSLPSYWSELKAFLYRHLLDIYIDRLYKESHLVLYLSLFDFDNGCFNAHTKLVFKILNTHYHFQHSRKRRWSDRDEWNERKGGEIKAVSLKFSSRASVNSSSESSK